MGETMTPEWKALGAEILPQRKSKRVHIQELQMAWAAYMKTLEKEPWWNRLKSWIKNGNCV